MTAAATPSDAGGGSRRAARSSRAGGTATANASANWDASVRTVRPTWMRVLRAVAFVVLSAIGIGAPWWGPRALAQLDFFHVHRVEFEGLRYAKASELLSVLRVDTTQSVWQPLPPLGDRLTMHPLVAEAEVLRRLPGTLVARVVERAPVALAPVNGVLRPADASGRALPIDPARVPLDIPIVASADSAVLQLLDGLRQHEPAMYARVTEARRVGRDEVLVMLGAVRVRTSADVTVGRFRDILPVEADLARNHLRVVEFDLRFRDQVIARQP